MIFLILFEPSKPLSVFPFNIVIRSALVICFCCLLPTRFNICLARLSESTWFNTIWPLRPYMLIHALPSLVRIPIRCIKLISALAIRLKFLLEAMAVLGWEKITHKARSNTQENRFKMSDAMQNKTVINYETSMRTKLNQQSIRWSSRDWIDLWTSNQS